MVSAKEVDRQLKKLGVSFWLFGRAELRELRHILVEGETIEHLLLGRYEGGFAILCATNLRLLLIDKKPFYLTLEDVRYDMIVEVDFGQRLIDATIRVCTPNKDLKFTCFKKPELRLLASFVQDRVLAYRQQHMGGQQSLAPASQDPLYQQSATNTVTQHSLQGIAQTALDGASRKGERPSVASVRQAINPYARSSFMMRQRISRF